MTDAISFPEYTCWNDEDFRHVRKPVVFRLYSIGTRTGQRVDVDFTADYGVWYHQNDDQLIWLLSQAAPEVKWAELIIHRKWTKWGIDICDPETDRLVARVEVRKYRGRRLDVLENDLGGNVVRLDDYRTSRLNTAPVDPEFEQVVNDVSA